MAVYLTKLFDSAREDVSCAMDAGVAYYTGSYQPLVKGKPPPDNVRLLEANLLLGERNVRASIAVLKAAAGELDRLVPLERDFVAALTAGFGEADPTDPQKAQAIVLQGAPLRQELAQLRQRQLQPAPFGLRVSRGAGILACLIGLALVSFLTGLYVGTVTAAP